MKLCALFLFFILLRLYPIFPNNFPFAYDNAKDSLEIMEMGVRGKPALVGAVTSMDGLYQGPFWYYVFLPINMLLGFHPIASVITVLSLGVLTIWLLYKYLGVFEAFLFTISPAVIATGQTAWSPYLTIFPTTWALILITRIQTKPTTIHLVLLALCCTILFHAEIAFGVVFCAVMGLVFLAKRIQPNFRQWCIAGLFFLLPFTPQAIFELRHDFLQTRSVIRFVTNYGEEKIKVQTNSTGLARFAEVGWYMGTIAVESITPYRFVVPKALSLSFIIVTMVFLFNKRAILNRSIYEHTVPVLLGASTLYLFLPIKQFYLIGLIPFWLYLFAQICKRLYAKAVIPIGVVFGCVAVIFMFVSRTQYNTVRDTTTILYGPKLEAVESAYRLSEGKPFASYQYVADVYDYTYQHIYQYTATQKKRSLPTEYAYAPNELQYMQTVREPGDVRTPEHTILIVEADPRPQFFPVWWDKITQGKKIIKTEHITQNITVYLVQNEL